VYDVGLHQGMVYLVMEYVDGHTLSAWLHEAPRSRAEILRVFAEAGRGLGAAHDKGLVHRDFKPENVLVARDGRARVTDFGLARESESWLAERVADDQASTELYAPTRGLIGTPAYMAPELFEGGRASAASDQFAFCVALFVALFDKHPFKAGEGIGLSELITRVRGGTLQRPPLPDAASQRLFAVLARGLAAAPAARHPDISALLLALDRAAGTSRRALWWGAALATLAALVVWASWRWGRPIAAMPPALASAGQWLQCRRPWPAPPQRSRPNRRRPSRAWPALLPRQPSRHLRSRPARRPPARW
jgi:serine/threonine protein kinase